MCAYGWDVPVIVGVLTFGRSLDLTQQWQEGTEAWHMYGMQRVAQ